MSELLIESLMQRLRDVFASWPDVEVVETYPDELVLLCSDGSRLWVEVQEVESD